SYIISGTEEATGANNSKDFFFDVTDKTFGSLLPESEVTPANYMRDIAAIWAVSARITKFYSGGNIYYLPKGNNYVVDTVRFGLANTPADIKGTGSVIVDLHEWDDKNKDDSCSPDERTLVGTNAVFIENQPNYRNIKTTVWEPDSEGNAREGRRVKLKDNTSYFLVASSNPFEPTAPRYTFLTYNGFSLASSFDRSIYTSATNLAFDTLKINRTSGSLWQIEGVNGENADIRGRTFDQLGNTSTLHSFAMMYLEMDVVLASSTYDIDQTGEVKTFPNPASQELYIDVALEKPSRSVRVELVTIDGKMALSRSFDNVQNTRLSLSLDGVISGTYNVLIHTDQGLITKKVIVQK
ncbi:MAG: T9SS type A sorting domain-containing protein, partial [Saprospiraceae bacterium]